MHSWGDRDEHDHAENHEEWRKEGDSIVEENAIVPRALRVCYSIGITSNGHIRSVHPFAYTSFYEKSYVVMGVYLDAGGASRGFRGCF